MARKYLLSVDGGGIKGIIPLCLLINLEKELRKPGSQLAEQFASRSGGIGSAPGLRDVFDFVAGTSTGSIIVAGIQAGLPAEQMLDLYIELGRDLFPSHLPLFSPNVGNDIERVFGRAPFSITRLNALIAGFTRRASQYTLDDCPTDVLLTGKGIYDGKPWYFVKNRPGHNSCRTGHLKLIDCVTASAAAPLYFDPWMITEDDAEFARHAIGPKPWQAIGNVVDGGVGVAGNPTYQACVEAFEYSGGAYDPDETTVISLGTGSFDYEYIREADFKPNGLVPWVEWIVSELLRSPSEQQTELAQRQYQRLSAKRHDDGESEYRMYLYRLNVYVNRVQGHEDLSQDIDMADASQSERLVDIGQRFAEAVDWPAILSGRDTAFLVNDYRTTMDEYGWPAKTKPF
jgi:predicted acylesterase/phospholipase RssA